jgi:hypothetical protein
MCEIVSQSIPFRQMFARAVGSEWAVTKALSEPLVAAERKELPIHPYALMRTH